MLFGLTRGEILLVVFIFAIVYMAGLLPKLAKRLGGAASGGAASGGASKTKPESTDD